MTTTSAQFDAVIAATRHIPEANFTAYRGGCPQEISTALIDVVFSSGPSSTRLRYTWPWRQEPRAGLPFRQPVRSSTRYTPIGQV